MNDVMNLTIPQLEYILEGCSKNNEEIEARENGGTNQVYKDKDAIQYLLDSKQTE